MIIDCCSYNGEKEIWDIHYNVLKDYVDQFIVVQFDKTFSGQDKPFYEAPEWAIPLIKKRKIRWLLHTEEVYGKYLSLAKSSPNTIGAEHWTREFMQKESIKDALTHSKDGDIVFIGDVDEIWNVSGMEDLTTYKLKLRVYTYWLNNRSTEEFWGTLVAPYGIIKNECLNHLRTCAPKSECTHGWHFTSMAQNLAQKLKDSYSQEDYASPTVMENLEYNIGQNKDFLGRDFSYKLDESEWPEFLMRNRDNYLHLIKQS